MRRCRPEILLRILVERTASRETPVGSGVVLFTTGVCTTRGRCRWCAAEVPAPGPPIDNRWNKKLEFVYSLVTQIRAAARHPRPTALRFPSLPAPSTTAADVSDQHEPASVSLPTAFAATTAAATSTTTVDERPSHHERCRARYQHQQKRRATSSKARQRRQHGRGDHLYPAAAAVTDTSTVCTLPLVSLYFSPLFPAPLAVSFRQTSLPNYLPVLAPNAFVKR